MMMPSNHEKRPRALRVATLLSIVVGFGIVISPSAGADTAVIKVSELHVGDGQVIKDGMIIVSEGRIHSVGVDLAAPDGATVFDLSHGVMTPGLIDANALIEPTNLIAATREPPRPRGWFMADLVQHEHDPENCAVCDVGPTCAFAAAHDELDDGIVCPVCGYPGTLLDHLQAASGVSPGLVLTETSSEVVPHTHLIDSLNLRSPDLERLMRGGVTTVFASPDTSVVIGPQGTILRTAGPIRSRVISPSDAVTASISTDPFRGAVRNSPPRRWGVTMNSRRPNTRMGLAWVFRKAFHDAQAYAEGRPYGGADTPSEPALQALGRILDGRLALRIHSRTQPDITSAIRLANEFNLRFTLLEATEAYKNIDEIRAAELRVIFGPIYADPTGPRARTWETRESRLATFADLLNAGIETALSAHDLREEDGLARQMMYAVRAGVDPADALRATTQVPAKLLGIDDRVGTLETGKDAELVVWNAPPHESGARPLLVMIGGRVVLHEKSVASTVR